MKRQLRNVMVLAAIAGSLSLVSCRETAQDEPAPPVQNEMREGRTDDAMQMESQANAEFKNTNTAAVYEHYLAVKTALVESDAALARENAQRLVAEMENTDYENANLEGAKEIAASTDINEQREAFSQLTKDVEPILEDAITSGEIYKQYCPMAFEGKGDYWFSDSQEIRNPYFGDKMLKCGRVEETIN